MSVYRKFTILSFMFHVWIFLFDIYSTDYFQEVVIRIDLTSDRMKNKAMSIMTRCSGILFFFPQSKIVLYKLYRFLLLRDQLFLV